ncbi:uncharacterized protein [Ambystoma mexicanum]|uniref:uncharacterized protein n=1 Tax=Ambystoma mexicanum TaxID=8296 RepID=UPI0037E986C2
MRNFFRMIRLKYFFKDHDDQRPRDKSTSGLKPPSTFTPLTSMVSPEIISFENKIISKMKNLVQTKNKHRDNLSKVERTALKNLADNELFVIKPADKGGGVVLWGIELYRAEVKKQLERITFYKPLPCDPTPRIRDEISSLMDHAESEGWIDTDEKAFLLQAHPITPAFYCLPKIHKHREVPPGRPIVAAIGSILEPLSIYSDFILRPFVKMMRSYVQDTTQMIKILDTIVVGPTDILVTLDVEALYTSIPQMKCVRIMGQYLEKRRDKTVPTSFIQECIRLALTNNFFIEEDRFYLQQHGTSMGSSFAPDLANLFMDDLETRSVYADHNPFKHLMKTWVRYIDDVFMLWGGTEIELNSFITWVNDQDECINFTMTFNQEKIPFLDLEIFKDAENKLGTTLFRKATDKNTLLLFDSFHPQSLRQNLPFGQFLRVRRNCTHKEEFEIHSKDLTTRLRARGYPSHIVRRSMRRAKNTPRHRCLTPQPRVIEEKITCVSTFSPISNDLRRCILKNWNIINTEDFSISKPRFAFRRMPNLRDKLVHTYKPSSKDKPTNQSTLWNLPPVVGHFRCGGCSVCELTSNMKEVDLKGRKWVLKHFTNCNSKWVVYGIRCPCGLLYIGKTKRPIRQRICEHRSCVKNQVPEKPLVAHFRSAHHGVHDIHWFIIEVITAQPRGGNRDLKLRQTEQKWIYSLDTVRNGLNISIEWSLFIHDKT